VAPATPAATRRGSSADGALLITAAISDVDEVVVDGVSYQGTLPLHVPIDSGFHTVEVKKGVTRSKELVHVASGEVAKVFIEGLTSSPQSTPPIAPAVTQPAAPATPATVRVFANVSGTQITIDDRDLGSAPVETASRAGHVRVVGKADGYLESQRTIEARAGSTYIVRLELDKRDPTKRGVSVRTGGVIGVGGLAGTTTRVWLDGLEVCRAPCDIEAEPGDHIIRQIHGDAFAPVEHQVTVSTGKTVWVPVGTLKKAAP
jgi:hypothetical protein